jgi:glycerol-3-phosphate dehydrogenase
MKWVTKEEVLSLEPSVNPDVAFGLYVKNIGITSPYEMTIAMIENAVLNGLELFLEHDVKSITYDDHYKVQTSNGVIKGRFIINAAGIHSGHINDMLGNHELTIHPRRGQYVLFGKDQNRLNHVVFQTPTVKGKGILVTPTVHGNLMVGPDAEDLLEEVTTATSVDRLKSILNQARKSVDTFSPKRALTTFSGIRAISSTKDFFIKYINENAITVGGIDSPGLTSAPAIAAYVIDLIKEKNELIEKLDFDPIRNSYYDIENDELICLCESQGKSRITACLEGPIRIQTTDAIKRRIRAGMGNCQGARCEKKVKELISEFNHTSIEDVLKRTESTVPDRVSLKEIRGITFEN